MGTKIHQRAEIIRIGSKVQILYSESNHISKMDFNLDEISIKERMHLEQIFAIIMLLNDTER